jgi:hypothetical protein
MLQEAHIRHGTQMMEMMEMMMRREWLKSLLVKYLFEVLHELMFSAPGRMNS